MVFPCGVHAEDLASVERPLWGDTHLHTALSFDAYTFGTTASPDVAYRYAKGLPVLHPVVKTRIQMRQPLDFLIIADHAEMLGAVTRLLEGEAPELGETRTGQAVVEWAGSRSGEELLDVYNALNLIGSGIESDSGLTAQDVARDLHGEAIRPAWYSYVDTAEAHNQPGRFTSLIGWEWTSQPSGANFHRVVFMPEDAEVAKKFLPYSTLESDDPEDLWAWLDTTSKATGAEFLAIPHGPNISAGLMFGVNRRNGEPIDRVFAEMKSRYEPAIEVTQIKGDSETLSLFSPDDQFADFETYNFLSTPDGRTPDPTPGDYVRPGLLTGLKLERQVGVNPYKMGMAGGTDSHVGIPAVEESSFAGKSGHDALPASRSGPSGIGSARGWDMGAAGFTAVWAEENSRDAIFNAFRRREIYASTGPRIRLRVFGGFDFSTSDTESRNFAKIGYRKGVPMGGDLTASDEAPEFIVAALKDSHGANLDRLQIIKGWLREDGTTAERVYDIALSDGRTDGSIAVGSTVNIQTGEYTNEIGDIELRAFWRDPEFDATQHAFYYVRVLEIPTPRYSLLDTIALEVDVSESGKPATIQERAYSSPIWYTP
jgi:hypothetical protein